MSALWPAALGLLAALLIGQAVLQQQVARPLEQIKQHALDVVSGRSHAP